jgi:hypothetical protein
MFHIVLEDAVFLSDVHDHYLGTLTLANVPICL